MSSTRPNRRMWRKHVGFSHAWHDLIKKIQQEPHGKDPDRLRYHRERDARPGSRQPSGTVAVFKREHLLAISNIGLHPFVFPGLLCRETQEPKTDTLEEGRLIIFIYIANKSSVIIIESAISVLLSDLTARWSTLTCRERNRIQPSSSSSGPRFTVFLSFAPFIF